MKTSVVMATYNGAKYLYEQLESLRNQTLRIDEVIICDDCSGDETVKILNDYISSNELGDRWKVIINEKNLGYANNFFQALEMAQGEYIFFSDQDDIWYLDKIEKMVDVMERNKQITLLCTDYTPFSSSEEAPTVSQKVMKKMTNDGSLERIDLNSKNIYIASLGCDMCIRKSFRDQIVPYWVKGWAHDDFVWKTAQCVNGCYVYHEALVYRRLHSNNVSMRKMHKKEIRVKFLNELAEANEGMYKFAESVNLSPKKLHFIQRTIKATKMRAELIDKKKMINSFKLLAYIDCYHSKKSILMEPYIALKK